MSTSPHSTLILEHIGLAEAIARRFKPSIGNLPYDDVASEAMLALVKTGDSFDQTKGVF